MKSTNRLEIISTLTTILVICFWTSSVNAREHPVELGLKLAEKAKVLSDPDLAKKIISQLSSPLSELSRELMDHPELSLEQTRVILKSTRTHVSFNKKNDIFDAQIIAIDEQKTRPFDGHEGRKAYESAYIYELLPEYGRSRRFIWPEVMEVIQNIQNGDEFLEIASGNGVVSRAAHILGAKVTAVDVSSKNMARLDGYPIEKMAMDALQACNKIPDNSSDYIVSLWFLHVLKEPKDISKLMSEFKRILHNEGKILLSFYRLNPNLFSDVWDIIEKHKNSGHDWPGFLTQKENQDSSWSNYGKRYNDAFHFIEPEQILRFFDSDSYDTSFRIEFRDPTSIESAKSILAGDRSVDENYVIEIRRRS